MLVASPGSLAPTADSWQVEAVLESCPNNGVAKYVAPHIKKGLGENHHE